MARRAFIKLMKALFGQGIGVESYFAYKRFNALLDLLSDGEEGSREQRYAVLTDLTARCLRNRDVETNELLTAWLKFNGAEIKSHLDGLPLTEAFIRHYLFASGEGREPLDISVEVGQRMISPDFLWYQMMRSKVQDSRQLVPPERIDTTNSPPGSGTVSNQRSLSWSEPDLNTALGNSTVSVEGVVSHVLTVRSLADEMDLVIIQLLGSLTEQQKVAAVGRLYPYQKVVLNSAKVLLQDRYDFDQGQRGRISLSASLLDIARILGGPEIADMLQQLPIDLSQSVTDFDPNAAGPLLEDQGYAHSFDIIGRMQASGPIASRYFPGFRSV